MCGLPCAGKTTRAREIERESAAVRFTPDEWLIAMFGDDITREQNEDVRTQMELKMVDVAARLLEIGVDVILDFGVWSREEREQFRAVAAAAGARSELHFLDAPLETLLERVERRSRDMPPGAFRITADEMRQWSTWLVRPDPGELQPREAPEPGLP